MSTAGRLDIQTFIALARLSDDVKQDTAIRRAETEERIALAKQRNLEWELGLRGDAVDLSAPSKRAYRTIPEFKPANKSSHSRPVRDVAVPAVVYKPRRSAAGLRSFHYSIEPIPKSSFFRQLASGTKIGPGAGEARVRYTTGIDDEQGYLLGDRVQSDLLGRPLIVSNISKRADKIADFFALVEENERNANPDKGLIVFDRHPEVWRRVVDDPACEPALLQAYRAAQGQGSVEVELSRGADALMKVLKRHGFVPADKAHPPRRQEELNGFKLTRGRGGRIQWRIVVALPVEFSARQRRRSVEAICRRLGDRGAMFAAVIHEPVATNHRNNYHAHIDVYDRPCRRLTGDARDLDNVAPKWRAKIKEELETGKLRHLKGQWDFAAVREYRSSSGNRTCHKPFRAKKSGAFRAYAFPKQHRAEITRIVNAIAVSGGCPRLYDSGTYNAMGIAKEPDEQLGPKRHGLEAKGTPSDAGMRNEERHAEADRHLIEAAYHRRLDEIAQQQRAFDLRLKQQPEDNLEQKEARDRAQAALADLKVITRARYLADMARVEMQRQLSRARNMIRAAGRAKRLGDDPRGELAGLGAEARSYWRAWQTQNQSAMAELRQLSSFVAREGALQEAARKLQAEALRPVHVAIPTIELAGSIAGATGQPVPEPARLAVTSASIVESEAPPLLGRRLKRLIEQAHHGSSPTAHAPRRNIMIRGPGLDSDPDHAGKSGSVEPTPRGTLDIDQTTSKTPKGSRQPSQPAVPMNSDRSDAVPAVTGRNAVSKPTSVDVDEHIGSHSKLAPALLLWPCLVTGKPMAVEKKPAALSNQSGTSGSEPPPREPEELRSSTPEPVAEQVADPSAAGPAAQHGLDKDSDTEASVVRAAPQSAARGAGPDLPPRSQADACDFDHAELIAAHLRKLDTDGVILRKNKATGEIEGSPPAGKVLSRVDELILRWGGVAAERLVRKQQAEIRTVKDHLLKHGEALARTGKQPGPRCQRLMVKYRDVPKLQKVLEWFTAEQELADPRKATDLAAQNALAAAHLSKFSR